MILRKITVGPYASNCYIIGSETTGEGMIIDPGADAEEILRAVEKLKLKIKVIVLTHRHPDHVGALDRVKQATGARVAMHSEMAKYLTQSPGPVNESSSKSVPESVIVLKEGDGLDIGELRFKVLHTPGHTPCGISIAGEGHVFTGDTLFNFGIGRYDLIDGDYRQLMDGIRNKLLILPQETVVHPGHGPDSTIATEKRANPFLR